MKHLTWKIYQALIQEARQVAHIEATSEFSTVRSRGWWLSACDASEVTITENADLNGTTHTLKSFLQEHQELVSKGATSISIDGGFDGADSLHEMNNGDYTPWVSEWSFEIWNSTDGWIQTPVRGTELGEVPFEYLENN